MNLLIKHNIRIFTIQSLSFLSNLNWIRIASVDVYLSNGHCIIGHVSIDTSCHELRHKINSSQICAAPSASIGNETHLFRNRIKTLKKNASHTYIYNEHVCRNLFVRRLSIVR